MRSLRLTTALLSALASFTGCDQTPGSTSDTPEPREVVVAVDAEGRPWKRGPEIKLQWPDDPRVDIAKELLRSHQYVQADVVLRAILSDRSSIGRARMLLGIAVQKQKHYAAALALLDEALATKQPFPEALHGGHFRGWCLYYLGRGAEAQAAFETHLALFPNEGDSHFGLGIIALESGQLDTAQQHLERAIELQTSAPARRRELAKAYARLGDVHLARGHIDDARAAYHTAVIRWPDHYEAWAKLARVLDRLDRGEEAARARIECEHARTRSGRSVPTDDAP